MFLNKNLAAVSTRNGNTKDYQKRSTMTQSNKYQNDFDIHFSALFL